LHSSFLQDDNFLVPTAPSVILKSPKFQKSEIKKDTISSDFASLDSYKNSAKIGRTDLSFANEPEILIRKSEHNACFGSSLDSYKQSELNSIRRNSNHSQLSTATPRGRSGSSGVRSGSGTPTIVEELEENESEHGSSEIIPTVKEKIPKLPSLGFSNLAVLPDSPTKTSVKDRIGQIQKQTCAKTLITPRSPSPALSITLSPITPRMDSVENMIEKISSTSSSSSIEAMNDKPETIWPSRHIDIPPENLSLESTPITFPMNTDLASPLQENSSKSNGKLTLEIPKIVEEIIENEIEHVSSDKALKVITESFPNKSLDGFGTMVSDSPTQTSVKYIVDKFQSPTNIESMSSSTRFSSSQEIPSTTTSPVQSEIPKSVKDMIGKWGIQKDIPDKIKEAVDVNIKSRRVSDRWKPLQKDVIDKVIQPKRPESSRMKNVTSTWGAVVTEASYKKKESEIIIGKLNSKA
jgi:membrane-associated HD superfamily phosphohydrolase